MYFRITSLYFEGLRWLRARRPGGSSGPAGLPVEGPAWDGVAEAGSIGRPGDLPVPAGEQLRRWGALLALAGLALPGVSAARVSADRSAAARAVVDAEGSESRGSAVSGGDGGAPEETARGLPPGVEAGPVPGEGAGDGLPGGDAGGGTTAATAAPWEAGLVEADGKPLPSAPPPGPVPVSGAPAPAAAAPPGRDAAARDLVPPEREYLRPILVKYAQINGLPADVVMALAWVESSWRRTAVSDAGAVGVMQLMPNTVEFVSKKLLGLRSNLDPRNATSNVRMGTRYLRHLLAQSHGDLRQALIAYNQGLTSLRTRGSYGAAERHAERVLSLRPHFRSW